MKICFQLWECDFAIRCHSVSGVTNQSLPFVISGIIDMILLRGIQLTHAQYYWGSTVKMLSSFEIFTFHEANICVALPNAWRRSVRALFYCYHNNTVMDQKVQLLKPLNLRELYTTWQNHWHIILMIKDFTSTCCLGFPNWAEEQWYQCSCSGIHGGWYERPLYHRSGKKQLPISVHNILHIFPIAMTRFCWYFR
jgi:hypothetical protein